MSHSIKLQRDDSDLISGSCWMLEYLSWARLMMKHVICAVLSTLHHFQSLLSIKRGTKQEMSVRNFNSSGSPFFCSSRKDNTWGFYAVQRFGCSFMSCCAYHSKKKSHHLLWHFMTVHSQCYGDMVKCRATTKIKERCKRPSPVLTPITLFSYNFNCVNDHPPTWVY